MQNQNTRDEPPLSPARHLPQSLNGSAGSHPILIGCYEKQNPLKGFKTSAFSALWVSLAADFSLWRGLGKVLVALILVCIFVAYPLSSHAQDSPQIITPENVDQLQLVQTLGRGKALDAQWSPDGEWFGVLTSRGVWLYPADDLRSEPHLAIETDAISMEFNPATGELWTSSRDGTLTRWQVPGGEQVEQYQVADYAINRLTFSPDGSRIAFVVTEPQVEFEPIRQSILLQDTENQTTLATIVAEEGYGASGIAFSDKYFITNILAVSDGFYDSIIEFHDIATGEVETLENPPQGQYFFMSPDGRTLYTIGDAHSGLPIYYSYDMDAQSASVIPLGLAEGVFLSGPVELSPDEAFIYFADQTILYKYNIAQESHTFIRAFAHPITSLQLSPNNVFLIFGSDGSIGLLEDDDFQPLSAHFDASIRDVVVVDDGVAVLTRAGSWWQELYDRHFRGNLIIFDANSGQRRYRGTLNAYASLAANGNGSIIATGTESGTVWFLDALTGDGLSSWAVNDCPIISLAFSPDDLEVLAGSPANVICKPPILLQIGTIAGDTLDVTSVLERPLEGNTAPPSDARILSLAYSSDGEMVVIGSYGEFYLWDGEPVLGYETPGIAKANPISSPITAIEVDPNGRLEEIAFSPSGEFIVTTGFIEALGGFAELPIYVYDIATDTITELDAYNSVITGLAISPDSHLIASSSEDGTVRLWDSETFELVHEVPMPGGANAVDFSDDGTELFIAGDDGTVRIWAVE